MNDKFCIFYIKDNEAYPVVMSNEQFEMLQLMVKGIYGNETVNVINKPIGEIKEMNGGK